MGVVMIQNCILCVKKKMNDVCGLVGFYNLH
jgi:hypothetical protein